MGERKLERVDLGEVPYVEAMEQMRGWVRQRHKGMIRDRLVLLTDPAVNVRFPDSCPRVARDTSIPLVEGNRGGQAT
jgi:lipoyl(octanoyl) transferase